MRRIRRFNLRRWGILAASVAVLTALGIGHKAGVFETPDRFLPQTLAYAQEAAPAPIETPTHVDSGVTLDLSTVTW